MNAKKLLAIVTVVALAAGAFAQGGGRGQGRMGFRMGGAMGANPLNLLRRDDVKDELKITSDQTSKIQELQQKSGERQRQAMQDAGVNFGGGGGGFQMDDATRKKLTDAMAKVGEETQKDVDAILTPEQTKRLKELTVQRLGNSAITVPQYQKDLNVTDAQKTKVADLQKKQMDAMQALGQKMRDQEIDMNGFREAMEKNNKIMEDELGKLLTDAQKAKLKELGGKPFTFKEDGPGF